VREQVPERDALVELWQPPRARETEIVEHRHRGEREERLVDAADPGPVLGRQPRASLQVGEPRAFDLAVDVHQCADGARVDDRIRPPVQPGHRETG
jgi:hypothetical protein